MKILEKKIIFTFVMSIIIAFMPISLDGDSSLENVDNSKPYNVLLLQLTSPIPTQSTPTPIPDLKMENERLSRELDEYRELEEDLMAKRVFDKAKNQLLLLITLGGIIITLSSIVGIKSLIDYTKKLTEDKIKTITTYQVEDALQQEGERQITNFMEKKQAEFDALVKQQIGRMTVAAMPIGPEEMQTNRLDVTGKVDYAEQMLPVRDMGPEGSIVGFVIATAMEYQIFKATGKQLVISPRHIYYYARLRGGYDIKKDSGALLKDGIQALVTPGAVLEKDWPYSPGEFAEHPPKNIEKVDHYKIEKYSTLQSLSDIKNSLKQNGPVIVSVPMFSSSFTSETASSMGNISMPESKDPVRGNIGICLVGFDDDKLQLKFKNQWSDTWGDKGYGYLPYPYLEKFLNGAWEISM